MSDSQTAHEVDPHLHEHPSPRKYVNVAIILAIVTAAEVAVYYVTALEDLLVPILAIMAFVKFVLVALYFMHLRFDSRIFRRLFVTGVVLAFLIFGAALWTLFNRGGAAPAIGG